jgi:hypothetical protein
MADAELKKNAKGFSMDAGEDTSAEDLLADMPDDSQFDEEEEEGDGERVGDKTMMRTMILMTERCPWLSSYAQLNKKAPDAALNTPSKTQQVIGMIRTGNRR